MVPACPPGCASAAHGLHGLWLPACALSGSHAARPGQDVDKLPTQRYDMPQTSNQEIGWYHKPMAKSAQGRELFTHPRGAPLPLSPVLPRSAPA